MKFDGQRKENNDEKHTCDGRNGVRQQIYC